LLLLLAISRKAHPRPAITASEGIHQIMEVILVILISVQTAKSPWGRGGRDGWNGVHKQGGGTGCGGPYLGGLLEKGSGRHAWATEPVQARTVDGSHWGPAKVRDPMIIVIIVLVIQEEAAVNVAGQLVYVSASWE